MTRTAISLLLLALSGCSPGKDDASAPASSCCAADTAPEDAGDEADTSGSDGTADDDGDPDPQDTGGTIAECSQAPLASVWLCVEGMT